MARLAKTGCGLNQGTMLPDGNGVRIGLYGLPYIWPCGHLEIRGMIWGLKLRGNVPIRVQSHARRRGILRAYLEAAVERLKEWRRIYVSP